MLNEQIERIRDLEANGQELSQIIRDKVMIDEPLSAILKMFADEREAEARGNLDRIHRLQQVKGLAPLVSDIAAIEAARVGAAGRGFAVLAAEIRELANRTAALAVDITQKITAATDGVDSELKLALATGDRTSTSSSKSRRGWCNRTITCGSWPTSWWTRLGTLMRWCPYASNWISIPRAT